MRPAGPAGVVSIPLFRRHCGNAGVLNLNVLSSDLRGRPSMLCVASFGLSYALLSGASSFCLSHGVCGGLSVSHHQFIRELEHVVHRRAALPLHTFPEERRSRKISYAELPVQLLMSQ